MGLLALVCTLTSGCGGDGDSSGKSGTPKQVTVKEGKVTIDGKVFPFPCKTDELTAILGKPSRRSEHSEGKGKPDTVVMVWDEQGIRCVEEPRKKTISFFAITLQSAKGRTGGPAGTSIRPKTEFTGKITLDGITIERQATPKQINEQLKGRTLAQSPKFPFIWSSVYHGATVTVETDDAGESIVEFSLRK